MNEKMKKPLRKSVLSICVLALAFTATSCLDDSDDTSNVIYNDVVSVARASADSCYFVGADGVQYIPSVRYTNADSIGCGVIGFRILDNASTTSTLRWKVSLVAGPIGLDRPVHEAATAKDWATMKNDSIIEMTTNSVVADKYLILVANYYMGTAKHGFTLCYAKDRGFATAKAASIPDTLHFVLRHDANGDMATTKTAYEQSTNFSSLPNFEMGFDISGILSAARKTNNGKNIYIDVEAKAKKSGQSGYRTIHSGILYD
jgi:hypothetical protein